ncbi:MAG: hypothetical protein ABIK92_10345 [Pseudomonadota bacterium]
MRITISLIIIAVMGIIAWKKGFRPWLWILAGGIPGLIILAFMPSATVDGLDEAIRERRRKAGNLVGTIFSSIAIILAITVVILLFTVKDIQFLLNLMYASLARLPWIIACLVAFAFIIVHWHKSPKASLWAARGVGLVLICQLIGSASTQFVFYAMKNFEIAKSEIAMMNAIIGVALTLLSILACSFLIVGVYSDRKTESVIPVNSISP